MERQVGRGHHSPYHLWGEGNHVLSCFTTKSLAAVRHTKCRSIRPAFAVPLYLFFYLPLNNWLVSHGPWSFMLDLAFQFSTHQALSRSQIRSYSSGSFSPQEHNHFWAWWRGVWGGREGRQRWKMTMSDHREGTEVFWCIQQCNYSWQTWQHIIPVPFFMSHIQLEKQGSSLLLLSKTQAQKQQHQQRPKAKGAEKGYL